jgi:hypothetical protein
MNRTGGGRPTVGPHANLGPRLSALPGGRGRRAHWSRLRERCMKSSERTIVQRRVGRRSRGGPSSALSADLASNYFVYDFQTGV